MPLEETLYRARIRRLTKAAGHRPPLRRTPEARPDPGPRHTAGAQQTSPARIARIIAGAFGAALLIGTALLMLPMAKAGEGGASLLQALFTATSALCGTGLAVVDTPTFWTPFGQAVILGLVQVGGFGVMSCTTVLGVLLTRKPGLASQALTSAGSGSTGCGGMRRVLLRILATSLVIEAAVAVMLFLRFLTGYGYPAAQALWHGVFHAVSAFNNAGFTLYTLSRTDFVDDPWIILPMAAAVILGGLGFPVLWELRREWRLPRR
ncbi:MAG TPA: potassium transporter TrkG [Kocuria rosea]|nr:potassium transporter TrkG [Kocuria rosea]